MSRERRRVQYTEQSKGRTHQSFKDAVDINKIVGKYRTTGFVEHVNLKTPVYGDFSNAQDFLSTKQKILDAEATFMALPARVRRRVDNDPAKLIAFVEDPANADELIELGLRNPIKERETSSGTTEAAEPTGDSRKLEGTPDVTTEEKTS